MELATHLKSDAKDVTLFWDNLIRIDSINAQDVIFGAARGEHRVFQTGRITDQQLEEAELPEKAKGDLVDKLDAVALDRGWPTKLLNRLNTEPMPEPMPEITDEPALEPKKGK